MSRHLDAQFSLEAEAFGKRIGIFQAAMDLSCRKFLYSLMVELTHGVKIQDRSWTRSSEFQYVKDYFYRSRHHLGYIYLSPA